MLNRQDEFGRRWMRREGRWRRGWLQGQRSGVVLGGPWVWLAYVGGAVWHGIVCVRGP